MENQHTTENSVLYISENCKASLTKASYWTKFLGTIFIVLAIFVVISMLFMLIGFSAVPGLGGKEIALVILYIPLAALIFYFGRLLTNFAKKTQFGLLTKNINELENGANSIRRYFKINAILQIIGIAFYLLMIVIAILGKSMMG